MLRVALVGIGDAGRHHARALITLAGENTLSWSALVARDAGRAVAFCAALGVPAGVATFPNLDTLLAADACDAVILAVPDALHAAQAAACIARGRHVLVEKPLALTLAEARPLLDAARAANTHLAVGYHLRHHAGHALIRARRDELVGELHSVYVRWAWPDPAVTGWRASGQGARSWSLSALGTHGIDLALWLGEAPAEAIAAVLAPGAAGAIDHAAEVSLRLATGALVHVSVSVRHRAVSRLLVTGSRGELEATGTLGARGDGEVLFRAPREVPRALAFTAANPYVEQLRAFTAGCARGFVEDGAALENLRVLDHVLS